MARKKITHIPGAAIYPEALQGFEQSFARRVEPVVRQAQGILAQNAVQVSRDAEGKSDRFVPPTQRRGVIDEIGRVTQTLMVSGADFRSAYRLDGVTPLSPFAEALNYWVAAESIAIVEHHAAYIEKRLVNHQDILTWLKSAQPIVREQFDPLHTWKDRRGYQLSQRIWNNSVEVRTKMELMLQDAFETQRGAFDLAKDLEAFLMPGQEGIITTKPYGRKAVYPALRLARSEIGRWHSVMTLESGRANPFASGMDWALSVAHPKIDICDDLATIGMDGARIKDPYPLDDAPLVVIDSHPQCICTNRIVAGVSTKQVVDFYRPMLQQHQPPPLTPMASNAFLATLLGLTFLDWFRGQRREERVFDD